MAGDLFFVRDHDDGVALLRKRFEQRHDLLTGPGVEIARGFVGQNDGWIRHQRAGDGDTLALSAGEFVRLVMDTVGQSDLRQRLQGRFLAFLVGQAGVNQWQFHVAQRIGARQQVERLENKADFLVPDPRKLVVVHLTDVDAVQFVSAGSRRVQATDEIHQGRFA